MWTEEALERYKRNEFEEAIIFLTSAEVALIATQKIGFDFPFCILKEHPELRQDDANLTPVKSTKCFGFIYYLPSMNNSYQRVSTFKDLFSQIGRVFI